MPRVLVLLCVVAAACGEDDGPCGQPRYTGTATDEAWRSLVDVRGQVTAGGAQAPVFTAPTSGSVVPATGSAMRITWSSPLARKPVGVRAPHLPPVTDDVYLVEISIAGEMCPVDLMTTELEWQLDADEWAAVQAAAPGTVTVNVIAAYLIENRISEGPFSPATPLSLRVE